MKKAVLVLGIILSLSSCSVAGEIIGGTMKAAGNVVGSVISATGKVISGIIGGKTGEVTIGDVKYKYSKAEVTISEEEAIVTGRISHNGPTKTNVLLEIPCQDKDGTELGYAKAVKSEFKKNENWSFKATLDNPQVRTCKMTELKVSEIAEDSYVNDEESEK